MVKNPPCPPPIVGNLGSIPRPRRPPGAGHGNPLQYSCLENPTARGAWWATVHRAAKSRTQLEQLSTYTHTVITIMRDFRGGLVVKNLPCNAGDVVMVPGQETKVPHIAEQLSPCITTKTPCNQIFKKKLVKDQLIKRIPTNGLP